MSVNQPNEDLRKKHRELLLDRAISMAYVFRDHVEDGFTMDGLLQASVAILLDCEKSAGQ